MRHEKKRDGHLFSNVHRHRSAMGQRVRLCSEPGLWFGVRLSDDCHRSVAVWAKGAVKAQPAGMIPRAVVALFRKGKPLPSLAAVPGSKLGGGITA